MKKWNVKIIGWAMLFACLLAVIWSGDALAATTYYVDTNHPSASNSNPGTSAAPFKTIDKAAQIAQAGDTVIVKGGTYREWVKPVNRGTSNAKITYRAADNEMVYIKGSERITNWVSQGNGIWQATLNSSMFGTYNPYTIALISKSNRTLGEVYVDGVPLSEVNTLADVDTTSNSWKASSDGLTLKANFGTTNPNTVLTEINVREQVFAPTTYNLGHITVKGFVIEHAANQFPKDFYLSGKPGQKGALSTNGGYDWIIENNTVRYAKSIGIDFGYVGRDAINAFTNATPNQQDMYRAVVNAGGQRIGHHMIRNNTVASNGSAGIMGMWGPFTQIANNVIEKNNRLSFSSPETGGIKTHYFIGGLIEGNLFRNNACEGIWADNNYQGARISKNVFVENSTGIWTEMGHGPLLIDNNVFIKSKMKHNDSAGTVIVHNLFVDQGSTPSFSKWQIRNTAVYENGTATPKNDPANPGNFLIPPVNIAYHKYYNNIFIKNGMSIPSEETYRFSNTSDYNAFLDGATKASGYDANSQQSSYVTGYSYTSNASGVTLSFSMNATPFNVSAPMITKTYIGGDTTTGQQIATDVNKDFFGNTYTTALPGPFKNLQQGSNTFTLFTIPSVTPTTTTLSPSADAFVRDGSYSTTNYGTDTSMVVKDSTVSSYSRKAYIKFDLTGVSSISNAKLRIYGSNTQDSTSVPVGAYRIGSDTWTETGITWSNAPAAGSFINSVTVNQVAAYYEIDVTSYAQSELSGDKTISLLLETTNNSDRTITLNSRENATHSPQLVISH